MSQKLEMRVNAEKRKNRRGSDVEEALGPNLTKSYRPVVNGAVLMVGSPWTLMPVGTALMRTALLGRDSQSA